MKTGIYPLVLLLIAGIAGIYLLYHLYSAEYAHRGRFNERYSGRIEGPFEGYLKYINIISIEKPDCIDNGFYMYFSGKDNQDFIIVTESVKESFGDLSDNIVGLRFRFERLMECKRGIENKRTFLTVSPPINLGQDE